MSQNVLVQIVQAHPAQLFVYSLFLSHQAYKGTLECSGYHSELAYLRVRASLPLCLFHSVLQSEGSSRKPLCDGVIFIRESELLSAVVKSILFRLRCLCGRSSLEVFVLGVVVHFQSCKWVEVVEPPYILL